MSKRCLLLKLPDNREIFTHEKHHHTLLEFAKTFDVKIFTVEADEPELLHPRDIAKAFCDPNEDDFRSCSYQVVDTSTGEKTTSTVTVDNNRKKMLQKVYDIRSYIEDQFLEKNTVRIKELHHFFKKHQIAVSTLYRHLSYVKDKLQKEGYKFTKISAGCYRLT